MSWRNNNYAKFIKGETKHHVDLVAWLESTRIGFWIHYPSEGKRSKYENYLWTIMGGKKHIPDFLFFDKIGRSNGLALELKDEGIEVFTKRGVPKAEYKGQYDMLQTFKRLGWKTAFASGRDEAIDIIKKYYKK